MKFRPFQKTTTYQEREFEMSSVGLSREELELLSSFGDTPEERVNNVYGKKFESLAEMIDNMGGALQRKMVELISLNNERIAKQLADLGVQLQK
jgi:hypothetical protein